MSTLKSNKSTDIFRFGNTLSMFVEAGFLGFVPLMLLGFNILACFQEASLVSQVIPRIEGSYYKALLYTGIALGAGIMFAPNFVWWRQIKAEIARMKKMPEISGKYEEDYIQNLNGAKNKHLGIWILCICTSLLTHGLTLFFCSVAFSNPEVLKSLSMKGMEDVSIAFCIVVTGSCFFLDILLGVFTNAQVDLDAFKPDQTRDKQHLKDVEAYNKIQKDQLDLRERLLLEQTELQKRTNEINQKEKDLKTLKEKGNPPETPSQKSAEELQRDKDERDKKTPTPPGNEIPKSSSGKLIYDVTDISEFFGTLMENRGIDTSKLAKALKDAPREKIEGSTGVAATLAKAKNDLSELYRKKAVEKDANQLVHIKGKIEESIEKVGNSLRTIGLQLKKK